MTFVESRVFTARWTARLDDEALRGLQRLLLERPTAGDPIPGCALLRKLRYSDASRGKGKRGGVRVIYMHTPVAGRIDVITVYAKDESDDLSPDEKRVLAALARSLRRELASKRTRKDAP